jgi:NAD(P)-dependent dehydrogenase (short-subunit alcohol dehydrogenase family)
MRAPDFHGKTAVVTGAASGIGRATALALARAGADLWICDVNERGLEDTAAEARAAGRRASIRRVDVSKKEEVSAFADEVNGAIGAPDILVNNAGVGLGGPFLHTPLEDWEWVVSINLFGVIHFCHFFLPKMVERGRGHVVNISSAAGYFAAPALTAYATSKFAVLGLSEALRQELMPHGIGVTAVCPGVVNTNITSTTRMHGPATASPGARERIIDFYRKRNYGPEKVADNIVSAIMKNRAVLPVTPEAWALYILKRLSPELTGALARVVSERLSGVARGDGS